MCVPGCAETIHNHLSRRKFLLGLGGAASLAACAGTVKPPAPAESNLRSIRYSGILDLTHVLSASFPTFAGKPMIDLKPMTRLKKDGYNTYQWNLFEHIGTHIDAPIHFSDSGLTVDQIPASKLVAPVAVIDIRARAVGDPDSTVTIDDIKQWESINGPLPDNCVVAMCSGWEVYVTSDKFRGADSNGMHFPGFHAETAAFLIEERSVVGIASDTLSLDVGSSKTFDVHAQWLSSNRWGIECLANVSNLPAKGATIVVGAPAIKGATGGPSRVLAFI